MSSNFAKCDGKMFNNTNDIAVLNLYNSLPKDLLFFEQHRLQLELKKYIKPS
jgi:hypothetical protein